MPSYLPLLPVLDVLEGRAGVWALDTPADNNLLYYNNLHQFRNYLQSRMLLYHLALISRKQETAE